MTTLRDGTKVDESITAANYTPAAAVPAVFGRGPRRIESITIHHWGLDGQRFDDVVRYLASKNARQSSAHAVIQHGRATSLVNPDDASWHAGNPEGAATSIGLELRPEATPGDYTTAAAYIAFLRSIYGNVPLIPHNHWTNTACPGRWDLARLDKLARTSLPKETKGPLMALTDKEQREILAGIRQLLKNTGDIRRGGEYVPMIQEIADIKTEILKDNIK